MYGFAIAAKAPSGWRDEVGDYLDVARAGELAGQGPDLRHAAFIVAAGCLSETERSMGMTAGAVCGLPAPAAQKRI